MPILGAELDRSDSARTTARWRTKMDPKQLLLACKRKFSENDVKIVVEGIDGHRQLVSVSDFESDEVAATLTAVIFVTDQWVLRWRRFDGDIFVVEFAALPRTSVDMSILRQMVRGTHA